MNDQLKESQIVDELAEKISPFFSIYDIQQQDDIIYFFGIPKEDGKIIYPKLWTVFAEKGLQFTTKYELGEHMLIASPWKQANERRWINAVLFAATCITTMFMGSFLFGADPILNPSEAFKGIPFTIAIMTVLGAHECGHYFIAKKHGMHTSLPYFIPFPSLIGTMGAVIKHRGPIPNRKALFDVGISGPLIGLIVSIIVTIIGLFLPPVAQIDTGFQFTLSIPPLFEFITRFIPLNEAVQRHPVAFAGWVGMLVTALNLIPSGQLDGGHVLRAMIGEKASHISTFLPFVLISLGFYVTYIQNKDGFMWVFWGLLLSLFAASGHPKPLNDDIPLDKGRMALGMLIFIMGFLCVTPVPFQFQ
ncbi:MAG: site-2 protease family protein [Candidatus Methanoperedens sp.]|nr:site-2 protease family protein [Candidatus Methanoperedens sp.]MCE8424446.1 site-2 protease family protein [Candidatus Methanoperedens sp.]MCE8427003.1 site-2 protease family protein [Candidatus Methanoperedens sp.]